MLDTSRNCINVNFKLSHNGETNNFVDGKLSVVDCDTDFLYNILLFILVLLWIFTEMCCVRQVLNLCCAKIDQMALLLLDTIYQGKCVDKYILQAYLLFFLCVIKYGREHGLGLVLSGLVHLITIEC